MTVAEALRAAAESLAAVSDTARLDAELLMAHALDVTRSELLLRHMGDPAPAAFDALIARRRNHEPVAYIIGKQEFYGRVFLVTPDVLIPRADSETVIEAAREAFSERTPQRILDLGVGSGALLLTAMGIWPEAEGMGVDRDPNTIVVALKNAERLGVNVPPSRAEMEAFFEKAGIAPMPGSGNFGYLGRARFNCGDWHKRGWRKHLGQFDLILANPPYVESGADLLPSVRDYEPAGALFAGTDGLDDYRALIPQLPPLLSENGIAVLEIGAAQAHAVTEIAESAGFSVELHKDLASRPRVLVLRLGLGKSASAR